MNVAFLWEGQQILFALFSLCANYAQNDILGANTFLIWIFRHLTVWKLSGFLTANKKGDDRFGNVSASHEGTLCLSIYKNSLGAQNVGGGGGRDRIKI